MKNASWHNGVLPPTHPVPPTGYVGLILRSTAVVTTSPITIEGTMRDPHGTIIEGTLMLL